MKPFMTLINYCKRKDLPLPQGECRGDDETTQLEPAPSFDDLNEEQQCLVEAVLQSIESVGRGDEPVSNCFYVDAPGGSGKTYVFNKLASYLQHHSKHVACAAWTGIAANLMFDGRTVRFVQASSTCFGNQHLQCVSNFNAS